MAPQTKTSKGPSKTPPTLDRSTPESSSTQRHDFPGLIRPPETGTTVHPTDPPAPHSSSDTLPAIQIRDLTHPAGGTEDGSTSNPHASESIRHYELPTQLRTRLPAVNTEGLRVYRGRIYAEVQYTTTTTVMVAWDEALGTYRAMRPQELQPSGPFLYLDTQSNTWRVGEPQIVRQPLESTVHRQVENTDDNPGQKPQTQRQEQVLTQPDMTTIYVDTRHYVWNKDAINHHGYVVLHRKMRRGDSVGPLLHHAFMDDGGSFVSVEPSASRIDQPAELLPAWTDRDIWDLYGIQGAEITRFRTEAHSAGKKPLWATVRAQRMENAYLFDELYRWSGMDMDRGMFDSLLNHQNRTPAQWAEHLESVTLHRSTSGPQTPLPSPPTPGSPSPRPSTPDTSRTADAMIAYGDQRHYTWDLDKSNFHGYVEMQRKPGLNDNHGPLTQLAFREGARLTVVKPTDYPIYKESVLRPFWRDIDIWNLYRIEGPDIARFRRDVALHQKPPGWVKQREYPSQREQLIDYLRLWSNPDSPLKSREQIVARFQPYNLSVQQLVRLSNELSPTGQFNNLINDEMPAWVRTHQERTRLVTNEKLFDPFLPEIDAEIIQLRNHGEGTSLLKASLTEPFFQELLRLSGFKRNKHNYLYRTDIPAVFKVDDRTPFEIARPAAMVPRVISAVGATSEIPVSAMFSLKTAMDFANETRGVTGKEAHQTTSGTTTPPTQRILFCYLLDTRNVEVVAGQDNRAYNPTRLERSPTDGKTLFPSMRMEGHVSMSSIGFTSRRVWLVNSGMTRAATVEDIHLQALKHATGSDQNPADAIEARTRAGELNRKEYDALIDEVAKAGKRVIELPERQDIFSDDIVFPPETITL
ncbi:MULTISPECIES: hypothetical protein [Pseudomonas]|uniref:Uncharacterized protein n=1 Tax=Pseudomonas aphyarum TaxID=2942629 RepID=A0ABT5PSK9_9PSED|nr:hypothetical protein [Pseudomonas aphyarum]MDD0968940.1 hypothetical protein [Pseudomonas aphyarum]MDD1126909.1 hypothetical protein [Pseudomonas aphyarum]